MEIDFKGCTLAILNAQVWTAEKDNMNAEAIAVNGEFITKVGTNEEIEKLIIKDKTKVIDAKNSFVCPGFTDSHIHFLMGGERLTSVKLKNAKTKEDFIKLIGDHAKTLKPGQWITGGDWDHIHWGGELPHRNWVDSVTQFNPIWLGRHEGHTYFANTLALKLAGLLDKEVEDVEGGTIVRDSDKSLTGIFKDNAISLVFTQVPTASNEEFALYLKEASDYVVKHGVTSIHHMTEPMDRNRGGEPKDLEVFFKHENELKTRIYAAVPIQFWKGLVERKENGDFKNLNLVNKKLTGTQITEVDEKGSGYTINSNASHMLRCGALKGYVDGSLGSHSAAFFEDFSDTPGYNGTTVNTEEELYNWIVEADKFDLQIFTHAIGDRGIHSILNIFEKVIKVNGAKDRRWRIEHSQHIKTSDIPRFKELGVTASVQPFHAIEDGRFVEQILGKDRLQGTYAFNSLLKQKAVLAFGSDWFVAPPEPLVTIDAAVNRNIDGHIFMPEETVTIEQALLASTIWPAWSVHEEHIKGSIKEGKLADLVFLDKNLLKIDPKDILSTKVEKTILGGKIVYEI